MAIKKWTITNEEALLHTPIFSLFQHDAQSPEDENKKGKFFHFKLPGWVNVIAITKDQKVVMVEQYRHGNHEISLEIPGGIIDPGEDPLVAGVRELREEAGGVGSDAEIIGVVDANPAMQDNSCWTILVRDVELAEQSLDELEEIAVHLIDIDTIPDMIRSRKLRHSLVVAAFQHYHLWLTKPE